MSTQVCGGIKWRKCNNVLRMKKKKNTHNQKKNILHVYIHTGSVFNGQHCPKMSSLRCSSLAYQQNSPAIRHIQSESRTQIDRPQHSGNCFTSVPRGVFVDDKKHGPILVPGWPGERSTLGGATFREQLSKYGGASFGPTRWADTQLTQMELPLGVRVCRCFEMCVVQVGGGAGAQWEKGQVVKTLHKSSPASPLCAARNLKANSWVFLWR